MYICALAIQNHDLSLTKGGIQRTCTLLSGCMKFCDKYFSFSRQVYTKFEESGHIIKQFCQHPGTYRTP